MTNSSEAVSVGHRIVLAVEYDGSAYSGWQKQGSPELPTVQAKLESALSQVADQEIQVTCAGRTDSGVHATCQVVHFDTKIDRGNKAWVRGVNSLLPESVRVIWSQSSNAEFHSRFSATGRRYIYLIHQTSIASAMFSRYVTHLRTELNVDAMQRAAQYLLGEQDFTSFRAAGCQSKSSHRNVFSADWRKVGQLLVFDIHANAFLQHMVRNIVGSLIVVGRGEEDSDWIETLLQAKDRTQAAMTAPPEGLYLVQVDYPPEFNLPPCQNMPLLLHQVDHLGR